MNGFRLAVIGCGHLGRIHARLATQLRDATLVAVADPCSQAREQAVASTGATGHADYRTCLTDIDAAILAAPTSQHASIGEDLIAHGIHVLIEKPLTTEFQDASKLNQHALDQGVVVAVGHVERFNPAFTAAAKQIQQPLFLEAVRTGGFSFRSTDVGVVFDLMIHDLDLILSMVGSPVVNVDAVGLSVITAHEDLAEARLTFANGCVAQLKASRASTSVERRMAIYERERHTFVDFGERSVTVVERSESLRSVAWNVDRLKPEQVAAYKDRVFQELLPVSSLEVSETNPLQDELQDFVDAIREHRAPRVPGTNAAESVRLAAEISGQIASRTAPRTLRRAA